MIELVVSPSYHDSLYTDSRVADKHYLIPNPCVSWIGPSGLVKECRVHRAEWRHLKALLPLPLTGQPVAACLPPGTLRLYHCLSDRPRLSYGIMSVLGFTSFWHYPVP